MTWLETIVGPLIGTAGGACVAVGIMYSTRKADASRNSKQRVEDLNKLQFQFDDNIKVQNAFFQAERAANHFDRAWDLAEVYTECIRRLPRTDVGSDEYRESLTAAMRVTRRIVHLVAPKGLDFLNALFAQQNALDIALTSPYSTEAHSLIQQIADEADEWVPTWFDEDFNPAQCVSEIQRSEAWLTQIAQTGNVNPPPWPGHAEGY